MNTVHNSVETVNAAATAIVTAESRVQPSTVQKRRWGSWWSLYWCFGSYKHSKRISHAVLVSEPAPRVSTATVADNPNRSAAIILPFIAPPSSPASFLPSDPPSATHSPAGLLSLSVHTYSPGGTAPIFTIGPYAHETQLVSPPVFSTFTTEPSTAAFTPPPEPVQMTTPSSPDVPFAELLSSSLAKNRRNSGGYYRIIGYDNFSNYKWGSRVGSGSLTPSGWGSRLGSGALTPNGWGSRLGSGALTPNGWGSRLGSGALTPNGWGSRLGSGALTPNGGGEQQASDQDLGNNDGVVDHRVSFELNGEDIPTCIVREPVPVPPKTASRNLQNDLMTKNDDDFRAHSNEDNLNAIVERVLDNQKHRTVSFGSSKDFNFNNAKGEQQGSDKSPSTIDCEWWTNDKVVKKELGHHKNWTFFPMLQSGVS